MESLYLFVFLMPLVAVAFVWVNRSAPRSAKLKWSAGFAVLPFAMAALYFGAANLIARAAVSRWPSLQSNLEMYGLAVILVLPLLMFLCQAKAIRVFLKRYPLARAGGNGISG